MSTGRTRPNSLWMSGAATAVVGMAMGASAQAAEGLLEEIVVTAQKREQRMQEVGIAVTAYGENEIRNFGFKEAIDAAAIAPNVTAINVLGNNSANFVIRGIGLNDIAPNNSSPTAVHVDEVYYGFGVMLNFALFDVERIEVLRGPQGTLYGRNTTAGAVSFFSNKPGPEFEADVRASYGNYDNSTLESFINVPLSETLSARFSGIARRQSDGPWYNRTYDRHEGEVDKYGWRAQLNFQPNSDLEINLNVHGGRERSDLNHFAAAVSGNGAGGFCRAYFEGPLRGAEPGCFGFLREQEPDTDPFTTGAGQRPILDLEGVGAVVKVDWQIGGGTLTSISGLDSYDRFVAEDADGFAQQIVDDYYQNDIKQYSQELRFAADAYDGALNWIVGTYWGKDELDVPRHEAKSFFARGIGVNSVYEQNGETAAAFLHGDWRFSQRWSVNAGARYTWEQREFSGGTWITRGDPNPNTSVSIPVARAAQRSDSKDFSAVTGKLGLDYFASDDVLLYGFVSKGFKSGGFNGNLAFADGSITQFDQEILYDYEVGAKTTWLDGGLIWNTTAFYYDYQDVQLLGNFEIIGPGGLAANLITLANLADAEVRGVETEVWWRPRSGLDLRLSAGWLESKIVDPRPGNEALAGNELANSPAWTLGGLVRYEHPVTSSLNAVAQVDFSYKDDYFAAISNAPVISIDDYVVANARIGLVAADSRWDVALWGKNILNEEYAVYAVDLASTRRVLQHYGYPRTYGIEFHYRWD